MVTKFVLVVSGESGDNHGRIRVCGTSHETESSIEALLMSGLDRECIRVFKGVPTEFEVSYRPIVTVTANGHRETPLEKLLSDEREPELAGVAVRAESRPSSVFRRGDDEIQGEAGPRPMEAHRSDDRFSPLSVRVA